MKKGEELRKYKRNSSRVWEKAKYRDKEVRKVKYSRGKKF